jgi:hypothetical protein
MLTDGVSMTPRPVPIRNSPGAKYLWGFKTEHGCAARWPQIEGPVWAMLVVVHGVAVHDRVQVPWPGDEHPVDYFGPDGAHPVFGRRVRRRTLRWDLRYLDLRAARYRVERPCELPGLVADQETGTGRRALLQLYQQVPGLLGSPGAVRVRGDAEDMDVAGADADDEEHIEVAQGDCAVDMEEVTGEHGRGLRSQELPPGGVAALRRWRYPQPFQQPPHRRGSDPEAQAEQLALDPLVAPARKMLSSSFPALCEARDYVDLVDG